MADRLQPEPSSAAWQGGFCAVSDGETCCLRLRGHDVAAEPHVFRDPSGSGRWIEKDDFGAEVARGPLDDRGWMGESPLRRRDHPFLPEHPEEAAADPSLRDRGRCCGYLRAAAVHAASEAQRTALEMRSIRHTVTFSRETLDDAPILAPAFADLLAGTTPAPEPEPVRPPSWELRTAYMTVLHEVVRWSHRELDRAQLGEPATSIDDLGALLDRLRAARRGYAGGAEGMLRA